MKNIYYILFALFFAQSISAQDPHFIQFSAAAQQTNPALTGLYDGSMRISANYREQWNSITAAKPFSTVAASFDLRRPFLKGDFIGIGGTALRDESQGGIFVQNRAHLSLSYMKQLGGSRYSQSDQYLIVGAQGGLGQNALAYNGLWYTNQFDIEQIAVDRNLPTGEAFPDQNSQMYADFNAGLMWYALFGQNQSLYFGGAIHHINQPNISIYEEQTAPLSHKYSVQAGGELPLTRELSLLPTALVQSQGKSLNIIGGASFRYNSRDWRELALRMGAWAQLANKNESGVLLNAIVVGAIIEAERLQIGLSYDLNTSSLNIVSNGRGGFELSVTYLQPAKGRRQKVSCPKF